MSFSDFVKNNSDAFDFDGNGNIVIDIDSSMLSGVTVDTYSTFTGEGWEDCAIDYLSSFTEWLDYPVAGNYPKADIDYDDIEFTYNQSKVVELLSDSAAESLWNNFDFIVDYEVKSTFSPGAYNFSTDSFNATWTIDVELLSDHIGDFSADRIEQWARNEYASRSGFHSNIPSYFGNEYEWAIVWASIQEILINEDYDGLFDVVESEYEIMDESHSWEPKESAYRKVYTAITGERAPKTVTDEDTLLEALPAYQDEVLFTV